MSSTNLAPPNASPVKSSGKQNRHPAPSLFVGPPSRAASQLSLARIITDSGANRPRDAAHLQKSAILRAAKGGDDASIKDGHGKDEGHDLPRVKKPSKRNVDAKWREMQSTLNEVELTAQSTTQVFSASHAAALRELRNAQVALARSWGRGNDEQAATAQELDSEGRADVSKGGVDVAGDGSRPTVRRQRTNTQTSASTVLSDESQTSAGGESRSSRIGHTLLEEEASRDIRRATERRAANEAYFKKVDQNVKEVVDKLEQVAAAMRGVEAESRSLWSQSDTVDSDGARSERPLSPSNG